MNKIEQIDSFSKSILSIKAKRKIKTLRNRTIRRKSKNINNNIHYNRYSGWVF